MIYYSGWQWDGVYGTINCYASSGGLTISGSGTGWTASGTVVQVSPTSVSSYYQLNLAAPSGFTLPSYESAYPIVQYTKAESKWLFYSNSPGLQLYNTISGDSPGQYDALLTVLSGSTPISQWITISFLA